MWELAIAGGGLRIADAADWAPRTLRDPHSTIRSSLPAHTARRESVERVEQILAGGSDRVYVAGMTSMTAEELRCELAEIL